MADTKKSMHDEIAEIVNNCFSDELVQKAIQEQIKNTVESVVEDLFKWGEVKEAIRDKLKEVMIPAIKTYDFSEYINRVDYMLTDLANDPDVIANKRILDNFRTILTPPNTKTVPLKDLFKKYCEFVADNFDTSDREVEFDGRAYYAPVECFMQVDDANSYFTTNRNEEKWRLAFHVENGENDESEYGTPLNYDVILYRWSYYSAGEYTLQISVDPRSLSSMSEFEAYLNSLISAGVRITVEGNIEDTDFEEQVIPSKEPEPTFE